MFPSSVQDLIHEETYRNILPFITLTNDKLENTKILTSALGFYIFKKIYKHSKQYNTQMFFNVLSIIAKATVEGDFEPTSKDVEMVLYEINKFLRKNKENEMQYFDVDRILKIWDSQSFQNYFYADAKVDKKLISFVLFLKLKPKYNEPTIVGQYNYIFPKVLYIINYNDLDVKYKEFKRIKDLIEEFDRLFKRYSDSTGVRRIKNEIF